MTFEVVERKVTPTLKNAEGTAIDLATAFNIGNAVTIDFAVEGVDTILPESATYIVKYLVNGSTVEVTDRAFTPLNAGQYSVVVKYVDANGYESASEEVILDTVGRAITPAFSVGGEVIDINNPIFMDSVVTISATVEGVDAPESANFSYKVVRIDSTEQKDNTDISKRVELDVVNGQFTAYYTGTYNIFVYYKEGQVTHASEMITLIVKAENINNPNAAAEIERYFVIDRIAPHFTSIKFFPEISDGVFSDIPTNVFESGKQYKIVVMVE
jgi:hypothetical protein